MAKKILVVDDDPVGMALMQGRLTKAGYEVVLAQDGQAGLDRVGDSQPDAIILDIEMPSMNGYTFITELKKNEAFARIPVIVQTAHEENRGIFVRRGVSHYLVKPINFDVLLQHLNQVLGN